MSSVAPQAARPPHDSRADSRGTRARDFRSGFGAPFRGLAYLGRQPRLWKYAALPIVLNVLITAAVLVVLLAAAVGFARYVHPRFDPGLWGTALEVLSVLGLVVVAVALAAGAWLVLNGILCGHYYTKLAREVELELGLPREWLRDVPFWYQVADTFRDLAALLAINAGLLLLNVIPALGSVAAIALGVYFDGFLFGRDFLDYPLSLRGYRRREKLELCRAHRWETTGIGTCAMLSGLIPLAGAVLGAGAAVGAVLVHRGWEAGGDIAPPSASDVAPRHPAAPGSSTLA